MFVLLPTFALILKLLYLRSRRYYTEHLILALHNHSFILQMLAFHLGVTAVERMLGTHWLAAALS